MGLASVLLAGRVICSTLLALGFLVHIPKEEKLVGTRFGVDRLGSSTFATNSVQVHGADGLSFSERTWMDLSALGRKGGLQGLEELVASSRTPGGHAVMDEVRKPRLLSGIHEIPTCGLVETAGPMRCLKQDRLLMVTPKDLDPHGTAMRRLPVSRYEKGLGVSIPGWRAQVEQKNIHCKDVQKCQDHLPSHIDGHTQ